MSGKRSKRIRHLVFHAVHAPTDEASEEAFKELQGIPDLKQSELDRADRLREERRQAVLSRAGIDPDAVPAPAPVPVIQGFTPNRGGTL